jgi:(p)ppGpp synthase/HD superfamily hydrolase
MLEQAIALAVEQHRGQVDKAGQPYILHPLRVMAAVSGETAQIVAVLHDVVEDCNITFADLRARGFTEEIIVALDGVTRRDNETYDEFITRSGQNPFSRQVKLADLQDNMDIRRLPIELTDKDISRLQRYRYAWAMLTQAETDTTSIHDSLF